MLRWQCKQNVKTLQFDFACSNPIILPPLWITRFNLYFSFGIFSFAYYSMGLEFNVELTYPIDQAIGTAMIFACGQIQAAIFILVSGALEQPLTADAEKIQVQTVYNIDITLLDDMHLINRP